MKPIAAPLGSGDEQPAALFRAVRSSFACGALTFAAVFSVPGNSLADEGGVSFWVPGFFGSFAAAPQQPGWSLSTIYYHTSVSGGGDVALAREFEIGGIPANLSATANASVHGTGDIGFVIPAHVFATPVLGGQAAVSVAEAYGNSSASLNGTVTGTLSTPFGSISFSRSANLSDSVLGISDFLPIFSLRWNSGVNTT